MTSIHPLASITLLVCLVTGTASAIGPYWALELDLPAGAMYTVGMGLNDAGVVAGGCTLPNGANRPTTWNGTSVMSVMNSLEWTGGWGIAINNSSQVVGLGQRVDTPYKFRSFLWYQGTIADLGTLGGDQARPSDINNPGQVVGSSTTSGGVWRPYVWQNGTMTNLGYLPADSVGSGYATAINNLGQVVGYSGINGNDRMMAFLWQNGVMAPLGTLGGASSFAKSINDMGQVVGASHLATGGGEAFLWSGGVMSALGKLPGYESSGATAINNDGLIVGDSCPVGFTFVGSHAVAWENGQIYDLNALTQNLNGTVLNTAYGINENGTILAKSYQTSSGEGRAFLLVPVPEPAGAALLALAGSALLGRRRRLLLFLLAAGPLLSIAGTASATDVFNMGGTRNATTGQWTGLASLEFVTVGDPGNAADTRVMQSDGSSGYGAVGYTYQMGKYEVTAAQYCQMLNAVATASDPYELFNTAMAPGNNYVPGFGITRSGSLGHYTYSVTGNPNFPLE